MANDEIKKDLGDVFLKMKTNIYEQIKTYMEENGYNVKYCDICSVEHESFEKKDVVKFKFVHWSVPTMITEPYYKIVFNYEN
jgi:DNA-dependent RNA polymerase auxiliary subunit epsilon